HLNNNHLNYNYNRFISHLGRPARPPSGQWYTPAPFLAATQNPLSRDEAQQLLELYYLIQMITLYRRAAPRRTKLDELVEQLKDDYFEQQLRDLLHEVEGFDEVAILGSHAYDRLEPWNLLDKGRFVNDYRQLIPALHRVLDVIEVDNYADEDFREKLKQLKKNVEGVTVEVIQKELNILEELDSLKWTTEKPWTIQDILAIIFGKQGQKPINDFDENYDIVEEDDEPVDDGKVEEFWVVIDDSSEDNQSNEIKPGVIDIRHDSNGTLEVKSVPDNVTVVVEEDSVIVAKTIEGDTDANQGETEATSELHEIESEEKSDSFEFKPEYYENNESDTDDLEHQEISEVENREEPELVTVVENAEETISISQTPVSATTPIVILEGLLEPEKLVPESKQEVWAETETLPTILQQITEQPDMVEAKETESIVQLQQILDNPGSFPEHYNEPEVIFESEKLPEPIDVSQPAEWIEPKEQDGEPLVDLPDQEEVIDELEAELLLNNLSEEVEEQDAEDIDEASTESVPLWESEDEAGNETGDDNVEAKSDDLEELDRNHAPKIGLEIDPDEQYEQVSKPTETAFTVDEDVRRYVVDEVGKVLDLVQESHGEQARSSVSAEDLDRMAAQLQPGESREIDEKLVKSAGRVAILSALQDILREKDDEASARTIEVLEMWKQDEEAVTEDGYFERNYGVGVEARKIPEDESLIIEDENNSAAVVETVDEQELQIDDDVEIKEAEEISVEEPEFKLKNEATGEESETTDNERTSDVVEQKNALDEVVLDKPEIPSQSLNETQEATKKSSVELTDDKTRGNLQPFPEEVTDETEPLEVARVSTDERPLEDQNIEEVLSD
ncbi:uncharacterized protein LOC129760267, partial [Uranotaenia lowii]|uniref:uncharacterized protein LOC129760267 n=1 Tax=Uranotaenia lowii TaxID=190385 RepID=UPI00247B055B